MKAFLSSTLLLGIGSVIHALRVIVLSFLLGNADFGAVSTVLLISTLFAEFGPLGFSQLIYNQRLYTPGLVTRASVNVSRFLATGLAILVPLAIVISLAVALASPFHFVTLLATLVCAGANVMILAACRAARSKFTHAVGYAIKSVIVLADIAVLGSGLLPTEYILLVGEILATPVLLVYAWRSGVFPFRRSILAKVPEVVRANKRIAFWALASSMSALLFLNQERMAGALFFTLEEMGVITKIILIKIIGAQSAFLFGTYFHRHVVGCDPQERARTFAQIRKYEPYAYAALAALCLLMTIPVQEAYALLYDIELSPQTALSVLVLGIVFFFNPFAILLQASGRFGIVARCNAIAIGLFALIVLFGTSSAFVIVASAIASLVWYGLIRYAAVKLL